MVKAFPILGSQGFHDSVNVTTGQVSHRVLALDQGMIMAAIANVLADDSMRHSFSKGPIEASIRPLVAPEEFTARDSRP
jgi:Putative glucoamylase